MGDFLVSWQRTEGPQPTEGAFHSPFQISQAEVEQAPLGIVTISGRRAELSELRLRQAENKEKIRKSSPRLAALRHPEPLDLA